MNNMLNICFLNEVFQPCDEMCPSYIIILTKQQYIDN